MSDRYSLQADLEKLIGSENVYFQPPENIKLKYPCIIYNMSRIQDIHADNKRFFTHIKYDVTIIDSNPDSSLPNDFLNHFRYGSFDRMFINDNLYHYTFGLYY